MRAQSPKRLGRRARKVLASVDAGKAGAWVPAIVSIELTLLHEAGQRLITATEQEAATRPNSEVRILPLDSARASELELFSAMNDPFDSMIVPAARATERPLITADTLIADSSLLEVVWDWIVTPQRRSDLARSARVPHPRCPVHIRGSCGRWRSSRSSRC